MKCPKCKTEVNATAKFCPSCGQKIEQKKGASKKVVGIIAALLVVVGAGIGLFVAMTSGGEKNPAQKVADGLKGTVEFADPTFERYVKRQLGKAPNESVSASEAAGLEELVIDKAYAELEMDYKTSAIDRMVLHMSLEDLEKLPNLKSFKLQGGPSDYIYNWEAIGTLKELEELELTYNIFQTSTTMISYGSKELLRALKDLPKLEHLILSAPGVVVKFPEMLKEEILDITGNKNIKIDMSNLVDPLMTDQERARKIEENKLEDAVYQTGSAEELQEFLQKPQDVSRLMLRCQSEETLDISGIEKWEKLEELNIFNGGMITFREPEAAIEGLDALKKLKSLHYLTIGNLAVEDAAQLTELPNLKGLSLLYCAVGNEEALENLPNLERLRVNCFESDEIQWSSNLLKGVSSIDTLKQFTWNDLGNDGAEVLYEEDYLKKAAPGLKELIIQNVGEDSEMSQKALELLYECKDLEGVELNMFNSPNGTFATLDAEKLQGMKKLEIVRLGACNEVEQVEALGKLPDLSTLVFVELAQRKEVLADAELMRQVSFVTTDLKKEMSAMYDGYRTYLEEAGVVESLGNKPQIPYILIEKYGPSNGVTFKTNVGEELESQKLTKDDL